MRKKGPIEELCFIEGEEVYGGRMEGRRLRGTTAFNSSFRIDDLCRTVMIVRKTRGRAFRVRQMRRNPVKSGTLRICSRGISSRHLASRSIIHKALTFNPLDRERIKVER